MRFFIKKAKIVIKKSYLENVFASNVIIIIIEMLEIYLYCIKKARCSDF